MLRRCPDSTSQTLTRIGVPLANLGKGQSVYVEKMVDIV